MDFIPLSANRTKWSNTLKQFVGSVSVFDHFVGLALKGLSFIFNPLIHNALKFTRPAGFLSRDARTYKMKMMNASVRT